MGQLRRSSSRYAVSRISHELPQTRKRLLLMWTVDMACDERKMGMDTWTASRRRRRRGRYWTVQQYAEPTTPAVRELGTQAHQAGRRGAIAISAARLFPPDTPTHSRLSGHPSTATRLAWYGQLLVRATAIAHMSCTIWSGWSRQPHRCWAGHSRARAQRISNMCCSAVPCCAVL